MENQPGPLTNFKSFVNWATTPPQSFAVYAICVVLVGGLSFFAGTLRPKKVPNPPQAIIAPRN